MKIVGGYHPITGVEFIEGDNDGDTFVWVAADKRWETAGGAAGVIPFAADAAGGDDSPKLQALVNSVAGRLTVQFNRNQTYHFNSTVTLPSGTVLDLNGALIVANISGAYPLAGSLFRSGRGAAAAPATTINAITPGALTVVVTDATGATVGGFLVLSSAVTGKTCCYKVDKIAGTTITLDRPSPEVNGFAGGDSAVFYSRLNIPQNIQIIGNNAYIQGKAVVTISLQTTRHGYVSDIHFINGGAANPSDAIGIFNDGCFDCLAERLTVDMTDIATGSPSGSQGLVIQSGDGNTLRDCVVRNCLSYGFNLAEGYQNAIENCRASGCSFGLLFYNDVALTYGSDMCSVRGFTAEQSVSDGVQIAGKSSRNTLSDIRCNQNGRYGMNVGDGANNAQANSIAGLKCRNNTTYGLYVQLATKGTRIDDADLSENLDNDFRALDEAWLSNVYTQNSVNTGNRLWFIDSSTATVYAENFTIDHGASGAAVGAIYLNSGRLVLDNGLISLGVNGSIGIWDAGGIRVDVDRVRVAPKGGITGTLGLFSASAACYIGIGFDATSTNTPISQAGGTLNVAQEGAASFAVTNADVTLTQAQYMAEALNTTGALGANHNVVLPTINGMTWDVFNNNTAGFTTTFKTAAGTGIVVAQTKRARLQCDGTNIVRVTPDT